MAVSSLEYSSQFDHTPFYCEENVYFLCKKLCANGVADADGSDLYVVFISDEKKQACMLLISFVNFITFLVCSVLLELIKISVHLCMIYFYGVTDNRRTNKFC